MTTESNQSGPGGPPFDPREVPKAIHGALNQAQCLSRIRSGRSVDALLEIAQIQATLGSGHR
jgi:hypothetical protein